jgi:hypothetical protein
MRGMPQPQRYKSNITQPRRKEQDEVVIDSHESSGRKLGVRLNARIALTNLSLLADSPRKDCTATDELLA